MGIKVFLPQSHISTLICAEGEWGRVRGGGESAIETQTQAEQMEEEETRWRARLDFEKHRLCQ